MSEISPFSVPQSAGFTAAALHRPVFQQDWWLAIDRGSSRSTQLTVERNGVTVGALPLDVRTATRFKLPFGGLPSLAHIAEPVVDQRLTIAERFEVIRDLIHKIPEKISTKFVVGPDNPDRDLIKAVFQATGFEHTRQITFWTNPGDADLLTNIKPKHQKQLRGARRKLDIVENLSAADFTAFYKQNLKARLAQEGGRNHVPLDTARTLIEEGQKRGQITLLGARKKDDPSAPLDAAVAIASDNERSYYWMSTYRYKDAETDPARKPNEYAARVLLIEAARRSSKFDADGVPVEADGKPRAGTIEMYRNTGFIHEGTRDVFTRFTTSHQVYDVAVNGMKQVGLGPIRKAASRIGIRL